MARKNFMTEKYPLTISEIRQSTESTLMRIVNQDIVGDMNLKMRLSLGSVGQVSQASQLSQLSQLSSRRSSPNRYSNSERSNVMWNGERSHSAGDLTHHTHGDPTHHTHGDLTHHTHGDLSHHTHGDPTHQSHGIMKKETANRKELRFKVNFNPEEIRWRRSTKIVLPEIKMSVPSHVVPRRRSVVSSDLCSRSTDATSKSKNLPRLLQLTREWKLKNALLYDNNMATFNKRQSKESSCQRQAVASLDSLTQHCQSVRGELKVLVIGAGLSGLSAAHRLLSHKFKRVQILEASDRVGGRIHSVVHDEASGRAMEMGAPGLHHCQPWNSVYDLASENGLFDKSDDAKVPPAEVHVFEFQNRPYMKAIEKEAMTLSYAMEGSNGVIKHLNDSSQSLNINMSYRDYVREVTSRHLDHMIERGAEEVDRVQLSSHLSSFVGDHLYRLGDDTATVAVQYLEAHTRETSDVTRVPRGMSSILGPLMTRFNRHTLKLDSKVKAIDLRSALQGDGRLVKVTCENGRVYTAHHVIVTLPLGYLKNNAGDLFNPKLPDAKTRAIEKLGFGSVSKVFLHYPEPLWSESFRFIWADEVEEPEDMCSRKTLTFTAFKDEKVVEVSTAGTYLDDVCNAYLRKLLTSVLSSYLQREVSTPRRITRCRWSTNPLFNGTHPFIGGSSSPKDVQELAEPIHLEDGTPIVLFAGDATFNSYTCLTHAARASGLRESKRLEVFYDGLHKHKNRNVTE